MQLTLAAVPVAGATVTMKMKERVACSRKLIYANLVFFENPLMFIILKLFGMDPSSLVDASSRPTRN